MYYILHTDINFNNLMSSCSVQKYYNISPFGTIYRERDCHFSRLTHFEGSIGFRIHYPKHIIFVIMISFHVVQCIF